MAGSPCNRLPQLQVSDAVVLRLEIQKTLPARQIVKFAPGMIERAHLDLPAVHRAIRLVHAGRRDPSRMPNHAQTRMFCNPEEQLGEIWRSIVTSSPSASVIWRPPKHIYVKSLVQHTGTLARDYSVLKATIGSTRVLRQAGIKAASVVVMARITIVSRIVAASEA